MNRRRNSINITNKRDGGGGGGGDGDGEGIVDQRPSELMKLEMSRSWYSSSPGRSSKPSRMFLCTPAPTAPSFSFFFGSSSVDEWLNRSRT